MVDVLTLNYNDCITTSLFVKLLETYDCIGHVLIVDNQSTDDSFLNLSRLESEKICLIRNLQNGGYGSGNNLGIKYLVEHFDSKYILLANPDVIVEKNVIEKMEFFLKNNSEFAIVAPLMKNPSGLIQYNSAYKIPTALEYILGLELFFSKFLKPCYYKNFVGDVFDVDAVAGSMFLMDASKMLRYGMFDEDFFLYCEELVLGFKMKCSNQKTALLTNLDYIHNHSVSINKTFKTLYAKNKLMVKSRLLLLKKYYKVNFIVYNIAKVISGFFLLEIRLIGFLKKYR